MKRAAELTPLSRQHHEALVLARRACEPQREPADQVRAHLLRRWSEHFEPHFACEEQVLLPALVCAGAGTDAASALQQHQDLRVLVERLREGDLACLPAWGEAMRSHVQWEERQLFPLAEALLDLPCIAAGLRTRER